MAVLCRGVLRRVDRDEVENADVLMGMEYSGAVGMMVINELAEVNSWVSQVVDVLKANVIADDFLMIYHAHFSQFPVYFG